MKPVTSLGIDLSTSATGLVLLRENKTLGPLVLHAEEIKEPGKGIERNAAIVARIMHFILSHCPTKIVLEGYSLNTANASSIIPLVEIGALLRFMLKIEGCLWYDPRAGEIKKFATGKGNSPKDIVLMHVFKRWGFESKTNNIADAYVCAAMGLAKCNRLFNVTKEQQALVDKLVGISN